MKFTFKNIFALVLTFCAFTLNAQIRSYNTISDNLVNSSVFIDASASPFSLSANTDLGKGMIFPRTDLTQFNFTPASSPFFETGYDGMVVYNTVSGTTPASGSGVGTQSVAIGFYYFSNPGSTGDSATGQWVAMGGDSKFTIGTSETETNTVIGSDAEYAIRVPGTADGTNTLLTLDAAFDLDTVKQLRKCIIYEGDVLIMEATSTFDATGNTIVTGDGMVNLLLNNTTANAYTAECYYSKN